MLDVNLIRENLEIVKKKLASKRIDAKIFERFIDLDNSWREMREKMDKLRAELNIYSKDRNIEAAKAVKENIKKIEEDFSGIEKEREAFLSQLPNLPANDWLEGRGEEDNKVIKIVGEKPKFDFEIKDYLALADRLGIIDTERAAKVSGSRFGYLFKEAALLELALIQFAFSHLSKKGFIPVFPPVMIKPDVYKGMGRLQGGQEEERYYLQNDDLYLVGSSEHTIGPIHQGEVFKADELPRRYVGFSTCFRREAGSYGKDTKGILRVHQFDKVEMFSFAKPEESEHEHQFLLQAQEELIGALGLHYQVVQVCTGDMGFTDAAQYDIETWLPGQGKYRETNSCSNTTDFQARGINTKFKSDKKSEFVHMLNATGYAIGRILIAILENYQTSTGDIIVPEVLRPYMGIDKISR